MGRNARRLLAAVALAPVVPACFGASRLRVPALARFALFAAAGCTESMNNGGSGTWNTPNCF